VKYKYKQSPLPGGGFDWLAVLPIQLSRGSQKTAPFEALIDSGASRCLFHADIAAAAGIKKFRTGKYLTTGGIVTGATLDLYAHDVRLHIGADSFKITGYFSDRLPISALLGRNGFFNNYIVTFDPTETNPGFELTRVHRT
jgi:hypothetical protein